MFSRSEPFGTRRKIEHLPGRAQTRGRDQIITSAGNITHVVYNILPALQTVGLGHTLLISNEPTLARAEREPLFADLIDHLQLISANRWSVAASLLISCTRPFTTKVIDITACGAESFYLVHSVPRKASEGPRL